LNGKNQLELETLRANTTLIVEAVKTGTSDQSVANRNIGFFIDAGLLKDPDGKITNLVKQGRTPVLPAQAPPTFRNGSQLPAPKERKIEVIAGDGRNIVLNSPLPPIGLHKVAIETLGTGVALDCELGEYRFKCIRLNRTVRSNEDGNAQYVFDRPIPYLAVQTISPSYEVKLGDSVKSQTRFSWERLDQKSQAKILESAVQIPGAWSGLEPLELVQDGDKALQWMTSLVNKSANNDCLSPSTGYCGQFLFFKMSDDPDASGIAYCAVSRGLGIVSLPIGCEVYAVRQSGKWSIRALLSPQTVEGGFGGTDPGLYCNLGNTISVDAGSKIARKALSSIFPGGELKAVARGKGVAFAIAYNGSSLQPTGQTPFRGSITIHAILENDEQALWLSGLVAIDKDNANGQFVELTDRERQAFSGWLVSKLKGGLSSVGKVTCEEIPYFRWGDYN
jgi:hypothetical protein